MGKKVKVSMRKAPTKLRNKINYNEPFYITTGFAMPSSARTDDKMKADADTINALLRQLTLAEQRIHTLQKDLVFSQQALKRLEVRLTALLSKDQLVAAEMTACSPVLYLLDYLEINKDRLFSPSHILIETGE